MKRKVTQQSVLFVLAALFVLTNLSSIFEYYASVYVHGYVKYVISLLAIAVFGIKNYEALRRKNIGQEVKIGVRNEWMVFGVYAVLYIILHQFFEDNSNLYLGISSYMTLGVQFVAVLVLSNYVVLAASKEFCKKLVWAFLLIAIVDSIFSMYYLTINDQALRISSWTIGEAELAKQNLYGVANALHVYSYIVMMPVLLMMIKVKHHNTKLLWIVVLLLVLLILQAGYTMAILLMLVYVCYKVFCRVTNNFFLRGLLTLLIVLLVMLMDWGAILRFAAGLVNNVSVKERIDDLYNMIVYGEQAGALAVRMRVYGKGINGIINAPLFGNVVMGERMLSKHSTIIDIASDWGLVGLSVYGLFLYTVFRSVKKHVPYDCNHYFYEVIVLYLITILINVMGRYAHGIAIVSVMFPAALRMMETQEAVNKVEKKLIKKWNRS